MHWLRGNKQDTDMFVSPFFPHCFYSFHPRFYVIFSPRLSSPLTLPSIFCSFKNFHSRFSSFPSSHSAFLSPCLPHGAFLLFCCLSLCLLFFPPVFLLIPFLHPSADHLSWKAEWGREQHKKSGLTFFSCKTLCTVGSQGVDEVKRVDERGEC